MEEFKQRLIDYARSVYDMGQTRFEDKCGLAHGTIAAIKASGPSASVIMRIAAACPELNLNWLFRGDGSWRVTETPVNAKSPSVTIGSIQTVNIGNWGDLVELLRENRNQ